MSERHGDEAASDPAADPCPMGDDRGALSVRALVLAIALAVGTGLLVQQVALVYNAGEIESSVPPVPAVFSLLALTALNPLLRRLRPQWMLGRGEILVIYSVLVLTVAMSGRRLVRGLLAFLIVPLYYEHLADLHPAFPSWYAVSDPVAVRNFFEASPDASVPWALWAIPLLQWTGFLLISWAGLFCLLSLFQRRWAEQEHLRFPLLYLPLEMTQVATGRRPAFFRDRLMWIGFGVGFWYALPVVLSPIVPNMPDWKVTWRPFQELVQWPWRELRSVFFRPLPHLIGLGYLMSTENLFSIWASYVAQRLFWVAAAWVGFRRPAWNASGEHPQAMGAIVALALLLLWSNRKSLGAAARALLGARTDERATDDVPSGAALGIAIAGFAAAVLWARLVGVPLWMGLFVFALIFAGGLVYARIRAETGLPSYWALPFRFEERAFMMDLFGRRAVSGGVQELTTFTTLGWMTTGQYPQMGAYHLENLRLARVAGLARRHMFVLGLGAIALGLLIGYCTHLGTFYDIGALSSIGADGDGYYEVRWARGCYSQILTYEHLRESPAIWPNVARLTGGAIVLLLAVLRANSARWPVTPWGYLVACSYGTTYWASFLLTWAAHRLILRYGGMRTHVRAVPFFLGMSFGYMAATVAALIVAFAVGKPFSFGAGRRLYFDI